MQHLLFILPDVRRNVLAAGYEPQTEIAELFEMHKDAELISASSRL